MFNAEIFVRRLSWYISTDFDFEGPQLQVCGSGEVDTTMEFGSDRIHTHAATQTKSLRDTKATGCS